MRNEDFRRLVTVLENDPELLHDFMMRHGTAARVRALLSDAELLYVSNTTKEQKLADLLQVDDPRAALWRDESFAQMSGAVAELACDASCLAYTGSRGTCGLTREAIVDEFVARTDAFRLPVGAGVSCDENTTCSCTTGTCGGATCGGSTCSVTCSGESCGNTCGDSCGTTTNISRPGEFAITPWQVVRWR